MSRRTLRTSLRLLVAGAFLAAGAEKAFGLGGCPHHDLPATSGTGGEATGGEPHGGAAGGAHGATARDHSDHPERGGHGDHGPCTCLGACQPISAATLGAPPRVAADPSAQPLPTHEPAPGLVRARAPRPYSLPWSTAPPAIR